MRLILLLLSLLAVSFCSAYEVRGTVRLPRDALRDTRVTIDHTRSVGVREDGSFIFHNVDGGSHIVEVHHVDYSFTRIKVDIDEAGQITSTLHTVNTMLNPAARPVRVSYPLTISPAEKLIHFIPRESFDPISLLKQPMILMIVVTMVMVVVMPKMMGNMTPEEKRELAAMQNSFSVQGLMGKLQEDKSDKPAIKAK